MNASDFTNIFIFALVLTTLFKLWLARRHLNHIAQHRSAVPSAFRESIQLNDHQKAADYCSAKTRFGMLEIVFSAALLLVFTLGGGIQWMANYANAWFTDSMYQGMCTILLVMVASSLLEMPLNLYQTFVLEQRFGFNKMTIGLYFVDAIKNLALGMLLGLPLLFTVLWFMEKMGEYWWLYVWFICVLYFSFVLFIYPAFIAPLFNKFTPMQDGEVKTRIESLLQRCGFVSSGLFVMDGSKRSAHGNAYFTGFGKTKRIVFFDTLLSRLEGREIEAVLAHELGHFKRHHVKKHLVITFLMNLVFLWGLGQLLSQSWFFEGLGVKTQSTAMGLLLLLMVLPLISLFLQPIMAANSRKHEFEADAYAAEQTDAQDLISALVKLYQDNASTLTPDPLYSAFYYSHPPAAIRIAHLQNLAK